MKIPFKIGDVLVYIFIMLLTVGSFAGLYLMGSGTVSTFVTVELDGTVIGTYDMPQGDKSEQVRIDVGDGQYNLLTITSQGIFIEEANCPDQICVRWGKISKPGQTIVCLPHRLVISITGNQEGEAPLDDIAS